MTRLPEAAPDRLTAIHDRLLSAVDGLTASEGWRAMLSVAARFHSYSPNNVILIAAQRQDATRVAGYRTWTALGRQVRKGERGIAILAPVLRRADPTPDVEASTPTEPEGGGRRQLRGFRITHVFDISQTDGPDLPDIRPAQLDGAGPLNLWADLLDQVENCGYSFDYADLAPANGRTDFAASIVLLHRGLPGAQKVKTLAHELAHIRLHAPEVRPDGCVRPIAEVEAESVAYVVTAAHGLAADGYTVPYVAGWAGGDRDLVAATATRVLSCARGILRHAEPPSVTEVAAPAVDRSRETVRCWPTPGVDQPARVAQR